MKAIFIKELRENGKWALLMLVAVAIAFAYALNKSSLTQRIPAFGPVVLLISVALFPVVGFILGLLQVLQDSSPGRWSFLTHRPTTRGKILTGKIAAGVGLYLLATAIPLAAAEFWLATPGHVAAPFLWEMVLPRIADLLGGLMWYAAGLLVAARQARWIGSRIMPIGMALLGSALAYTVTVNFAEAMAIIAIVLTQIVTATWGAFTHAGSFTGQRLIAKIAAGLCVIAGLYAALAAAGGISSSVLESFARSQPNYDYKYYRIAIGGRMVIVHQGQSVWSTVSDLEGNPISDDLGKSDADALRISLDRKSMDNRRFENGFQRESRYLRDLGYTEGDRWYYVVPRRTIEGFDNQTRQFIGSIGPGGFAPASQTPRPFPEPLYANPSPGFSSLAISSDTTAYKIDLANRTIVSLFVAPPGDSIIASSYNARQQPHTTEVSSTVVVTKSQVHIFESGEEILHTPLQHSLPQVSSMEASPAAPGKYAIVYWCTEGNKGPWGWSDELDARGNLLSETKLPLLPWPKSFHPEWIDAPMIVVIPPGLGFGVLAWEHFTFPAESMSPAEWITVVVTALIALFLTLFLTRRLGLSRKAAWTWTVVNTLIGIPGMLLVVSLFDRIAKVPCPSCGNRRIVTRQRCEHCDALFSAPQAEGIEVFESAGHANPVMS